MQQFSQSIDERLNALFVRLASAPAGSGSVAVKVAIISTPRCGSKYFCESLASTGSFGHPAEWLNPAYIQAFFRVLQPASMRLGEYLDFIINRTTSANGLFALNFHVDQYMFWMNEGIDLLSIGFDKIYYLHRRDKLAQALSWAKAIRTGQWRSIDKPVQETHANEIQNSEILEALHKLSLMDEYYRAKLAKHVLRDYCYEDFTAGTSCFREVLRDCSVDQDERIGFECNMKTQRSTHDMERLELLKKYVGCAADGVHSREWIS